MNPVVVIPARLQSVRLPRKPLADIGGEPMIVHVWRRAVAANIGPVVVACADEEIAQAVRAAAGEALVTRGTHASGSDRVFEAVQRMDPDGAHDIVVNLQGDLPAIDPANLGAVLEPLDDSAVDIATLAGPLGKGELADVDVVKVRARFAPGTRTARALGFQRGEAGCGAGDCNHHIGIYGFRRAALAKFVALPPSAAERAERLEQLRAVDAGMVIGVRLVDSVPRGVDTPADLARARAEFARPPS